MESEVGRRALSGLREEEQPKRSRQGFCCFQVKSVSLNRFESLIGVLTADEISEIAAGIALCVGV